MTILSKQDQINRIGLGVLQIIIAINALGGGWYGMAGAKAIPLEWLEGSPFDSYLVPSLILFIAVGMTNLLAAFLLFQKNRRAPMVSLLCGLILLIWIVTQVSIIGYVSWLQPAMGLAALVVMFLAWRMRRTKV